MVDLYVRSNKWISDSERELSRGLKYMHIWFWKDYSNFQEWYQLYRCAGIFISKLWLSDGLFREAKGLGILFINDWKRFRLDSLKGWIVHICWLWENWLEERVIKAKQESKQSRLVSLNLNGLSINYFRRIF